MQKGSSFKNSSCLPTNSILVPISFFLITLLPLSLIQLQDKSSNEVVFLLVLRVFFMILHNKDSFSNQLRIALFLAEFSIYTQEFCYSILDILIEGLDLLKTFRLTTLELTSRIGSSEPMRSHYEAYSLKFFKLDSLSFGIFCIC